MSKYRTRQEKLELVNAFKESRESKVSFCKRNNLSVTSLNNWLRKEILPLKEITFMKVPQVAEPVLSQRKIELHIGDITLVLPPGTEPVYLGEVIKVLSHV